MLVICVVLFWHQILPDLQPKQHRYREAEGRDSFVNTWLKAQWLQTARQGDMKWKKILKDSRWCDKNGLNESFKMSPHLICLNWGINFHITSRPDPEAGHKRDLRPQLRHIKWGLILKLSMRLFSWHSPKSLRIFFHFESLSRSVLFLLFLCVELEI